MKDLTIALAQIDAIPNNIEGNLAALITRVENAASKGANLIISCELALSGFLMSRDDYNAVAQTVPGPATEELGAAARKNNAWVMAGLPERDGDRIYNTLAVLDPNGDLAARYRKVHLWLTENDTFDRGSKLCILETEFGSIGTAICYDIMFPEYIRAIAVNGAGLIAHSTGMVTTEDCDNFGWDAGFYNAFVRTRAWENQVYVASCNRCGNDSFLYFLGNSLIAAPWGEIVGKLGHAEGTLIIRTDYARLEKWRMIAPYWEDRRTELYGGMLDL